MATAENTAQSAPEAKPELNLPALCRLNHLLPHLPIARSTVWLWSRTGRFPAPIKPFGKACTLWRREEILAWLSKAGA